MKKIPTVFLQAAVALFGAGVLGLMLWVPPHEGRNAHATLFETYFKDPFLAYAYIGSLPFFAALRQVVKALGYAGRGEAFTPQSAKALRIIRYCSLATAVLVAGGAAFLVVTWDGTDDIAGGVIPGALAVFLSAAAAAAAGVLENKVRSRLGTTRK